MLEDQDRQHFGSGPFFGQLKISPQGMLTLNISLEDRSKCFNKGAEEIHRDVVGLGKLSFNKLGLFSWEPDHRSVIMCIQL